jgi:microsomal prostaglandin-E synthase 1
MLPGFRTFAACVLFLVLKMFVVAFLTPVARARAKARVNAEDASADERVVEVEPEEVARIQRIQRNDLENIPVFFMVGLLALIARATPRVIIACTLSFTVVRVLHTLCYLRRWSALRTTAWMLGVLSTLVLAGFTAGALAAK